MATIKLPEDAASAYIPSDTREGAPVAPRILIADKVRVSPDVATAPTGSTGDQVFVAAGVPAAPAASISRRRMYDGPIRRMTEAEGQALEVLRAYQEAESSPALMAELDAWDTLRYDVDRYRDGDYTLADAIEGVGKVEGPRLFGAVATIADCFDKIFLRKTATATSAETTNNASPAAQEAPTAAAGVPTDYETAQEEAARRADDLIARLGGIMGEIEDLTQTCQASGDETLDRAGLVLDAIGNAFLKIVPPLAPGVTAGDQKPICGALASALFGDDYAGKRQTSDEGACHVAHDGFQIAQIFTRAELGQEVRSGGHPVYYFLQSAAIVAQRSTESGKSGKFAQEGGAQ